MDLRGSCHWNTYHIAIAQVNGRIFISIEAIRILFDQFIEIVHQRSSILISGDKHETVVEQLFRFVQFYIKRCIAAITAIVLTSIYNMSN